jgi:hypothetical protein
LTTKICVFSVSTIYSITALQDIEESLALAKRLGVQVVVGVGSGAAIDVAKSVANILADDGSNDVELILSPATLGGCIASTSDEPLLLSTEEEALTFIASMLPGLCATIDYHDSTFQNRDNNNCLKQLNAASRLTEGKYWNDLTEGANEISTFYEIPSMASLAEGAHATSTLLDYMIAIRYFLI